MSKHGARSSATLVQTGDVPATINGLIADAVAACASVRASAIALHQPAEQKLRAIREAGRRLSLVQRGDGGRPPNNSSSGLTSYQLALKQAGISRQTADAWRRVAAIPEPDFEQFIEDATLTMRDLTVAELLRACSLKPKTEPKVRTVKLIFSAAEYRAFEQKMGVLARIIHEWVRRNAIALEKVVVLSG